VTGRNSPAQPRQRRGDRWVALLAVLTLACAGVFALSLSRARATATRVTNAERSIRTTLERQGAALLRGDQRAWLSTADNSLSGEMTRLYANLRGFQISGWISRTGHVRGEHKEWTAEVQIRVCFATPTCTRTPETFIPAGDVIAARTRWSVQDGEATLTAIDQNSPEGSVPWKRETLEFAQGERVVIAAPRGLAGAKPAQWLAAAERAARVADRYALSTPKPGRYFIFLAGPDQWNAAVGKDREATAFVDRISKSTAFAIIDLSSFGTAYTDENLLRHELGHIATLLGTLGNQEEWAVEGMAEYIAYAGRPVRAYDLLDDARRHVEETGWNGRLDLEWSPEATERFGYYAMGYLAMRCLGETYGEPKLLRFFTKVAREGEAPQEAAQSELGTTWETAQTTCRPTIKAWLAR
jgi:hypothetical protein